MMSPRLPDRLRALSPRAWLLTGLSFCIAMELAALYFQFVDGLEPCPLCITQRLVVLAAALVFLVGALHNPATVGTRIYAALAGLIAFLGFGVAAYHFKIQVLPESDFAECGPGAAYILEHMDLMDGIRAFLTGTGDCTEVVWSFLGLSMPFWVALCFLGLLLLCVLQWFSAPTSKNHSGR